eukprot:TRINITY_DN18858_c0_g1_i2.p1 TRINITY_DN18858_c0_g1~~TRINITY_DN18858_c0_g1_i2.p1  ORF type:complete len:207 (+),score=41.11 TRINITY_DN18858_c0_g1_i2:126-746(+)
MFVPQPVAYALAQAAEQDSAALPSMLRGSSSPPVSGALSSPGKVSSSAALPPSASEETTSSLSVSPAAVELNAVVQPSAMKPANLSAADLVEEGLRLVQTLATQLERPSSVVPRESPASLGEPTRSGVPVCAGRGQGEGNGDGGGRCDRRIAERKRRLRRREMLPGVRERIGDLALEVAALSKAMEALERRDKLLQVSAAAAIPAG